MKVTQVRLNKVENDSAVKAIGSFALDDVFAVRGIRVMEDKTGNMFLAFPSRVRADGSYEDLAFPLSKELYQHITEAVLDAYKSLK